MKTALNVICVGGAVLIGWYLLFGFGESEKQGLRTDSGAVFEYIGDEVLDYNPSETIMFPAMHFDLIYRESRKYESPQEAAMLVCNHMAQNDILNGALHFTTAEGEQESQDHLFTFMEVDFQIGEGDLLNTPDHALHKFAVHKDLCVEIFGDLELPPHVANPGLVLFSDRPHYITETGIFDEEFRVSIYKSESTPGVEDFDWQSACAALMVWIFEQEDYDKEAHPISSVKVTLAKTRGNALLNFQTGESVTVDVLNDRCLPPSNAPEETL